MGRIMNACELAALPCGATWDEILLGPLPLPIDYKVYHTDNGACGYWWPPSEPEIDWAEWFKAAAQYKGLKVFEPRHVCPKGVTNG